MSGRCALLEPKAQADVIDFTLIYWPAGTARAVCPSDPNKAQ